VAALGADQLVVDAAGHQSAFTEDDVRLAETVNAGGALATFIGFAAFVAVHALDGDVGWRPKDTAKFVLRADRNAGVHTHVTEFAGGFTEQRRANAFDTALAGFAVIVSAAFLADTRAAEEAGRTIGRASAAIGWIFLQVDAFAVTAGEALRTFVEERAAERRGNADAVAAFLPCDVAAGVVTDAAGEFCRSAADVGFFITLAGRAA
jgi:hypothetical protein